MSRPGKEKLLSIYKATSLVESEVTALEDFGFVFDITPNVYSEDIKIILPSVHNQNDQQDLTQRVLKLVRALRPGLR